MVALPDPSSVKVYTVNGASSGSSSSLPDWLTRKRLAKGKGKRAIREQVEGTIELIQHFEFPEASNKVKTTRDGHHAIATGTYKPHMKVWELDELALKFERHSDVENVDFLILSDDWTKTLHLQSDRSIELHTQSGFHYRTRIPKFGRAVAYHFPSCDALFAASGPEVYRLNLDQGRFLNPLVLQGTGYGTPAVQGVNAIDINASHQLFGFGVDGNGSVEFWDPRSRSRVGLLLLPRNRLLPTHQMGFTLPGVDDALSLSVTAISSRSDGLSYAIGTSTGHTLLYDIRSSRPFAVKDQGYGLPVKNVSWVEGGSRMAGDGLVISADKKVIKIWDRNEPSSNFASITPATDINDVHHVPGSGLLMLANEGIQMTTYYIPQLGPAPRWCSFLENITEELEDQTTRTVYEDYKFVERSELASLGLSHLIGTAALKPYMHGYFLSLKLYDAARVIANPFAYAEHRERVVRDKMDKMAETRIRTRKDGAGVKVNKNLAERVIREEEKNKKREERKKNKKVVEVDGAEEMDVDQEPTTEKESDKPTLLTDPRFKSLFEDPEFQVDENSWEFALLNPAAALKKREAEQNGRTKGRTKTAVEEEEEESDKASLDGSDSEEGKDETNSDDSSDADDLKPANTRAARRTDERIERKSPKVRLVPMRPQVESGNGSRRPSDKNATFGQRRSGPSSSSKTKSSNGASGMYVNRGADGGMEMSWVPSSSKSRRDDDGEAKNVRGKKNDTFGHGMERGGEDREANLSESQRSGRTHRRQGMRSGSKNTFRRI